MNLKALLFDTRSIQRYIYSSNRLKTNIGASYLVYQVFRVELLNALRKTMGEDQVDAKTWEENENPDWSMKDIKCRIGYIGGGNALALFREDVAEEDIQRIVTEFTKKLLTTHPGLHTGAAFGPMYIDSEGYYLDENGVRLKDEELETDKNCLTALVHQLKQRQGTVFPETNIPYSGLTQLCPEIGETATMWTKDGFISWETAAKRMAGEKEAKAVIVQKLHDLPSGQEPQKLSGFAFPDALEKLGQKKAENYIAIVHLDGNNMGVRFANCKTLTARKNLSIEIAKKTASAFAAMLTQAVDERESYKEFLDKKFFEDKDNLLPVRPLVLGGDDMTFICNAKLALRYTKRVMEEMLKVGIDTCAGIAIQPTNYPFFRGYTLAEEACGVAKQKMRAGGGASCWLDFVIRHGEQAPTLDEIRDEEYMNATGNMHFGPYRVDTAETNAQALANLIKGLDALKQEDRRLAMNKIKKLRDVIRHGSLHEWEKLRQRLEERETHLPDIPAWRAYEKDLWYDGRTPYIDLIEMLDFYVPEGGETNG